MRAIVALVVATGCAAPPIGIGGSARRRPASMSTSTLTTAWGMSVAPDHNTYQLEGSRTMYRPRSWLAIDAGGVVDLVGARDGERAVDAIGAFPYVQPRFSHGPWSAAITAAACAVGAGEGGAVGGFGDLQAGFGGDRWSIYGGSYGLAYVVADGGSITTALQARVGAEVLVPLQRLLIGVAVEWYRHVDSLRANPDVQSVDSSFDGFGLKLRVERDR